VVTARQIGPPIQQEGPIRCLKFSPDANRLLTSSGGNAACVWELAAAVSWPPFQELGDASPALATQGSNACVALSPDDRTTATASADGMIRIFNTANGTTQRVIGPLPAPVLALAFSPDGSLLLSGAADSRAPSAAGEAIFWQTASGQPLGPPLRHRAAVRCVAFSPDGKLALTGSDDQTAQLWSVAVGCSIGRAMQHPGEVEHVEFRSDGRQLTTVCLAKPTRRAALAAQNLDMDGTAETRPASHNAESPPARLTRTWPVPAPAADDAQTLVGRVKAMTGLELGPSDALQGIKSP
jgi:WD40 repeat protein